MDDLLVLRARFEAWSEFKWKYNLKPAREESSDTYMEGETETAWKAWQAALIHSLPKGDANRQLQELIDLWKDDQVGIADFQDRLYAIDAARKGKLDEQ